MKAYQVSQTIEVLMCAPKTGKMPIGIADTGIICLLNTTKKGFFQYGSTWTCEVKEVHDKKLIVSPIKELYSKEFNEQITAYKMYDLKNILPKQKTKQKKAKKHFPYLSKNEMK